MGTPAPSKQREPPEQTPRARSRSSMFEEQRVAGRVGTEWQAMRSEYESSAVASLTHMCTGPAGLRTG